MPPTITATDHPLEKLTADAVVVAVGKGPDGPLPTRDDNLQAYGAK